MEGPTSTPDVPAPGIVWDPGVLDGSFRLGKAASDAIDIPYSRMSEFDTALDRLFDTDDGTELMVVVADCAD